ncbi:hypothetical protein ACI1P2_07920 [Paenibacillus sp. p-8]
MSQANLPNITPTIDITREDAINLIIASIAMEELGLSHILNAEGEKLQYVLGTLPGVSVPPPTLSDLLAVNDSIRKTLQETTKKDWVLSNKLEMALGALPVGPTGPTGPTSPTGPTGPTCPSGTTCVPCAPVIFSYGPNTLPLLTCVPIIDGPTPCVSIELPSGVTCIPVPTGCVLEITPTGVTCNNQIIIDPPFPTCAEVCLGPTGPIIGPTTGPGPI